MRDINKADLLWWVVLIVVLSMLVMGCSKRVYVPMESKITEAVTLRDTVLDVRLERVRDSVVVVDTVSFLENMYAFSFAKWDSGRLHHSLGMKGVDIPVRVKYVEREKRVEIPMAYPVEVVRVVEKDLGWWGKLTMFLGNGVIVGLCGLLVFLLFGRRRR